MDFDPVIEEYVNRHSELDQRFRGMYLYQVSIIESYLDGTIAYWFFSTDVQKREALVGYVISDINFNQKIKLFFKILKNHYAELLKQFPKLSDDFEKVRNLRNTLAHSMLDTSLDYLKTKPKDIRFQFYKNGKMEYQIFSDELIKNKIKEVSDLFHQLSRVLTLMSGNDNFLVKDAKNDTQKTP